MWIRKARLPRVLWALFVGMGFALSQTEVFVPETHDGDVASLVPSSGGIPASPTAPGHDPSAPHACHCTHAHGFVFLNGSPALSAIVLEAEDIALSTTELHSVSAPPLLRPPIA